MTTLERSLDFLQTHNIQFAHTVHAAAFTARDAAEAGYLPSDLFAKTVVFSGNGYFFVVVPADSHVDLRQVRLATGIPDIRVASEAEVFLLFPNSELGAMPPLGPLFELTVYLDRRLARHEFICFNVGTHRDLVHMKMRDFTRLVKPIAGDFGIRERQTPNQIPKWSMV